MKEIKENFIFLKGSGCRFGMAPFIKDATACDFGTISCRQF
jgi:hypothetical protein